MFAVSFYFVQDCSFQSKNLGSTFKIICHLNHAILITIQPFSVVVCSDTRDTQSCSNQVQNRPESCNDDFMIRNCKKSCGLCPGKKVG